MTDDEKAGAQKFNGRQKSVRNDSSKNVSFLIKSFSMDLKISLKNKACQYKV
jgi:hypothetical protein